LLITVNVLAVLFNLTFTRLLITVNPAHCSVNQHYFSAIVYGASDCRANFGQSWQQQSIHCNQ